MHLGKMKTKLKLFGENTETLGQPKVYTFVRSEASGLIESALSFKNLWAFYLSCDQWSRGLKNAEKRNCRVFTEFLCGLMVDKPLHFPEEISDSVEGRGEPYVWKFLTQKSSLSAESVIQAALSSGEWVSSSEFLARVTEKLTELVCCWLGEDGSSPIEIAIGSPQAEAIACNPACSSNVKDKIFSELQEIGYFQDVWHIETEGAASQVPSRFSVYDCAKTVFESEIQSEMALLSLKYQLEGVCEDALELKKYLVRFDGLIKNQL